MQLERQIARHPAEVSTKAEKASNAPVIIAPIMLVAAKVMANKITETRIVPSAPITNADNAEHVQHAAEFSRTTAEIKRVIARKATATPKATHKNAAPTVITPVIRKNAVIMPITMLAITASPVQFILQL